MLIGQTISKRSFMHSIAEPTYGTNEGIGGTGEVLANDEKFKALDKLS